MVTSLNDKLSALSEKRQLAVQKRADELISEEMTLRDFRLALEKTQMILSPNHLRKKNVRFSG